MVLAGLGLNPAVVLPFRNHALHSSFRTKGQTSTELLSKPVACPAGVSLLVVALLVQEPVADQVATSTEPFAKPVPCPAEVSLLVVASFFFRVSESDVREF